MALDPNAFGPDSNNDSQQPGLRQQKMRALMGGKASLGSLFSDVNDTGDLSKSSLNSGETSSPLATPSQLGAPGASSLLSSERVSRAPSFANATPLLTGEQQAGAELSEAERGEEGVIGGGPGRQGLSTADRNLALMSFFRPQQQAAPTSETQPSDTAKAIGSAKSAVSAAGKAKSLFSTPQTTVPLPFSIDDARLQSPQRRHRPWPVRFPRQSCWRGKWRPRHRDSRARSGHRRSGRTNWR